MLWNYATVINSLASGTFGMQLPPPPVLKESGNLTLWKNTLKNSTVSNDVDCLSINFSIGRVLMCAVVYIASEPVWLSQLEQWDLHVLSHYSSLDSPGLKAALVGPGSWN